MDILVKDVSRIWPGRKGMSVTALQNFSYHFRSGRFTCLLGPSGCGKSTLIQIVGGIEDATRESQCGFHAHLSRFCVNRRAVRPKGETRNSTV
jgi:ABC-type Fe3+/spermidine/putrescine transport system ATPase subunit